MEPVEDLRHRVRGDAGAGVADGQPEVLVFGTQRDLDLAGQGELHRVGQQVEHDVFPHRRVDQRGCRQRRAVDAEPQPRLFDRGAEHAGEVGGIAGDFDRPRIGVQAPCLRLCRQQQRVDQPRQAQCGPVRGAQILPVGTDGRGLRRLEQVRERAEHEGQRGAELVADAVQQRGLRLIRRGQFVRPAAFGLVGVRGDQRQSQVGRDGIEKRPIAAAKGEPGAGSRHEHRRWPVDTTDRQCQHRPHCGRTRRRRTHDLRLPRGDSLRDQPRVLGRCTGGQLDGFGRKLAGQPGPAGQPGFPACDKVDQCERKISGIVRQHADRLLDGGSHRAGLVGPRRKLLKGTQTAFEQHPAGHFKRADEYATNFAVVVVDRAVGDGEVGFLQEATAVDRVFLIFEEDHFAATEHLLVDRTVEIARLGPAFVRGLAQPGRVLVGQDGAITVVVDLNKLRTP